MSRLEGTKARLERVLGRFEAIMLRMQALQADNQSLKAELHKSEERESLLRLAAYDALTEVDQVIAMIAPKTSDENESIKDKAPLEAKEPPVFDVFDQGAEEIADEKDEKSVSVDSIIESDDLNVVSIAQELQPDSESGIDFLADSEAKDEDDYIDTEVEFQTADSHRNIEDITEEKLIDQNDDRTKKTSGGSWSYLDD